MRLDALYFLFTLVRSFGLIIYQRSARSIPLSRYLVQHSQGADYRGSNSDLEHLEEYFSTTTIQSHTILVTDKSLDTSPIFDIDFITPKDFAETMPAPRNPLPWISHNTYVSRCHIMTILSSLPEARYWPFGENRTQRTTPINFILVTRSVLPVCVLKVHNNFGSSSDSSKRGS